MQNRGVPFTATDDFLAAWGALKDKYQKAATAATCPQVAITGTAGAVIPAASVINRSDGYQYTIDTSVTIGSGGTATTSLTAVLPDTADDTTGGGASGNAAVGTVLTFDAALPGVDSQATAVQAITGGTDIEDEEVFRSRVISAYKNTPQGGNDSDYEGWALSVAGVTRAWTAPRLMGVGTVGIYIMCDGSDSTNNGFPVGTDGVATNETYTAGKATGNQLAVANYIYPLQPVTALVYVCSPIRHEVDFIIDGISTASADTVASIESAIDEVFFEDGEPGGKIYLSSLVLAIGSISGTEGFVLTSPATNIVMGTGEMPVRGEVSFT